MQENIEKITSQKNSINNEHCRAVDTIKKYKESKKYEDNLETMKQMKGLEKDNLETMKKMKELKEDLESTHKSFDVVTNIYTDNLEKLKKMEEDLENAYKAIDILTKSKYDPNGFDIYGNHKDTGNKHDPNGFDGYNINGVNKNCLDRYGIKRIIKKTSKIKTSKAKSFKDQKG